MQHLPQGVQDVEGCFVYQIKGDKVHAINARSTLNVGDEYRTNEVFCDGDLVSIDLVSPSRAEGSNNGPFLRLADRTGWLFEKKYGKHMMVRIPVWAGLWTFVVDHCPLGIALRRHPIDRSDLQVESVVYQPMQTIHCDRKVQHPDTGVHFYRVQGTEGWVFDRRISTQTAKPDEIMLLEDHLVETGVFVYECVDPKGIQIRKTPTMEASNETDVSVEQGTLIAADAVRKVPDADGHGAFVRLTDGSGWISEQQNGQPVLKRREVHEGSWKLKVLSSPAGIGLRRQPVDSQAHREEGVTYPPHTILQCTHRVRASSEVTFYRVEGTEGWVFDQRGDYRMLRVVSDQGSLAEEGPGWSPEFVRGVAATIEGATEVSCDETDRVISFRCTATGLSEESFRINVYYATCTIGIALPTSHPCIGSETQLFRRHCSTEELIQILQNPRSHAEAASKKQTTTEPTSPTKTQTVQPKEGQGLLADKEAELRNLLLELDEGIATLQGKKQRVLQKIREADLVRARQARAMKDRIEARHRESAERLRVRREEKAKEQRENGAKNVQETEQEKSASWFDQNPFRSEDKKESGDTNPESDAVKQKEEKARDPNSEEARRGEDGTWLVKIPFQSHQAREISDTKPKIAKGTKEAKKKKSEEEETNQAATENPESREPESGNWLGLHLF